MAAGDPPGNVEAWLWVRRVASAGVLLSTLALILARTRSGAGSPPSGTPAFIAALCFLVSMLAFTVSWRKELATREQAAKLREQQQLELLKVQVELAKRGAEN